MNIVLAVCAFAFVCIALYALTGKTRELIDEERTRTLAEERERDRDALMHGVFPPTRAEGDDVP